MSARTARRTPPAEHLVRFGGGSLGLFGEMIVVGLVTTALSLLLVTALPALAAGTRHLDRHADHHSDGLRELLRAVWRACREGWAAGTATAAVVGLLGLNVALGVQGLVPGGTALAVVSAVLGAGVLAVAARAASLWEPGADWRGLVRDAADLTAADPGGTAYVLTGLGTAAVVAWMFLPLIVIAPGMLAVALLVARRRARS
ncbi:hypothetical protein SAMN05216298_1986 [Glycomyces sambucus]|uniref:Poxvirus protein I5 n=1 Tax=Glycomyces sambucus TaxID=380244 RepID=A0A1G9FRP8_9ACTN|nr:hypothetical protein [Glycomyces sambucus]SDK91070.1 hypothetical protein SAMN05216298_1986 [Glycomyces sambucus]